METVDRLNYSRRSVVDAETELGFTVKQTLNQGINESGVLSFRIPADSERFTDLNTVCLRVDCQVLSDNGTPFTEVTDVFFDRNGMHSIFSTCDVRFNDEIVSTMASYPYTSCLSRYVGCSKEIREGVWDELDGSWLDDLANSQLVGTHASGKFDGYIDFASDKSRHVSMFGRVYSDVLMSSRQYLPPGVSLGVELRRAPDNFSLATTNENVKYTLKLHSASLYVRRLRIQPALLPRTLESLKSDAHIIYNRLDTRIMAIPKGISVWQWLNCLNGKSLPNRLYIGFVAQSSLYGVPTQLSTYFENLNVSSINLKLNGRDIMVEPIKCSFVKDSVGSLDREKCQGQEGFLSLIDVMDMVRDQGGALRLSYTTWLQGNTIFAIELSKCGQKSGETGSLDLEVRFLFNAFLKFRFQLAFGSDGKSGSDMEGAVILFTEKTESISLQPYIKHH